jgi:hypothetical protein
VACPAALICAHTASATERATPAVKDIAQRRRLRRVTELVRGARKPFDVLPQLRRRRPRQGQYEVGPWSDMPFFWKKMEAIKT